MVPGSIRGVGVGLPTGPAQRRQIGRKSGSSLASVFPRSHPVLSRARLAVIAAQVAALGQPARIQFSISTRRHNRLRPSLIDGGTLPAAANACQWDLLQPHKAAAAVSGIRSGSDTLRGIETPITAAFVQPCGKFRRIGSKLAAGLDWSILIEPFPIDSVLSNRSADPIPSQHAPLLERELCCSGLFWSPASRTLRHSSFDVFFSKSMLRFGPGRMGYAGSTTGPLPGKLSAIACG